MTDSDPTTANPAVTPRQEELLDHALAVIREHGLPGLTVRRLAERAGFTEPALYRHFASKQELLQVLMTTLGQRLLGPIRDIAADAALPPRERIRAILRHHVNVVLDSDGLPVLVMVEATTAGDEAMLKILRRLMKEYLGHLEGLLGELQAAAQAAGDPGAEKTPGPPGLGLLLLGLVAASALRLRLLPDGALERQARGELVDYLVDHLLNAEEP
jgi:AcrR family transcriptional regulator